MPKKKKRGRQNKQRRAANILVFKLADPILQTLLFVAFIYFFDASGETFPFGRIIAAIVGWQALSMIVHLFIVFDDRLNRERIGYFITYVLALVVAYFVANSNGSSLKAILKGEEISTIGNIILFGFFGVSFWYFAISFREVRGLLTEKYGDFQE